MDLEDLNDSELVMLAQEVDESAHRGVAREVLVQIVEQGTSEDIDLRPRRVNKLRLKIMEFILDNWKQVEPLLSCPARTREQRACYQCTDVQAVECAVLNQKTLMKKEKDA